MDSMSVQSKAGRHGEREIRPEEVGGKWWEEHGYALYSLNNGPIVLDWQKTTYDELLSYRALVSPELEQFTVLGDGETITHRMSSGQMHDWAMRVAGLLARFVPERSRVLLCFENNLEAVASYFGCAYANIVPVSGVYPSAGGSGERLFDILEDSGAVAVLGLRQTLMDFRQIAKGRASSVKWIPIEGAENTERLYRRHSAELDDVALVQYTSGSIGKPRGVQLSHLNLGANLSLLLDRTGFQTGIRGISWLPLSHDMGLMTGLFVGAVAGGPCLLMSPQHFIEKPERWFKAISHYRLGFSAGPNFAYDLCTRLVPDDALEGLDLSCWRRSVIGAELIERGTVERFLARFGHLGVGKSLFRPGYGMAETTLLIASGSKKPEAEIAFRSYSRKALAEGEAIRIENADSVQDMVEGENMEVRVLASCGRVVSGHEILVVDPDTNKILGERQVGELWLGGQSVSCGYLNRVEETRERFGLVPPGYEGKHIFFRSRDMGFLDGGELYITGRMDYRLNIEGRAFDPDDLASVVRRASVLKGRNVFEGRGLALFTSGVVLHIVGEIAPSLPKEDYDMVMDNMAQTVSRLCPVKEMRVMLVRPGSILRTPSGKIRLLAMAEIVREGKMPFVAERFFEEESLGLVPVLGQSEKSF